MKHNPTACVFACDCSDNALELFKRNLCLMKRSRCDQGSSNALESPVPWDEVEANQGDISAWLNGGDAFVCNPALVSLPSSCRDLDAVLLVFTLSAVPPMDMEKLLKRAYNAMAPGGLLLIRDYGLYDMAMLRFPYSQCLRDSSGIVSQGGGGSCQLFIRRDGTLSFFFDVHTLCRLCEAVGLVTEECEYHTVSLTNRHSSQKMDRVWIHGKFRRAS